MEVGDGGPSQELVLLFGGGSGLSGSRAKRPVESDERRK